MQGAYIMYTVEFTWRIITNLCFHAQVYRMVDKTSMLIEGVGIDVYNSLFAYLELCSHCLLILPTMHCFVFSPLFPLASVMDAR